MGISNQVIQDPLYDFDSEVEDIEEGDFVYIRSDGLLGKALASDQNKMPAIGYVTGVTNSRARVERSYIESGLTEIENQKKYFISEAVPGGLQDSSPISPGYISQPVARGVGTSILSIYVDPNNYLKRS